MIEIVAVGEGQTEETFIGDVLAPPLWGREIFVTARLIRTSQSGRGGALTPARVLRYLRNTLRERSDVYVTTFFDLYGLRPDFPGLEQSRAIADPVERSETIERHFKEAVVAEAGCREDRFLAHIQPYEFESLLFSDTGQIAARRPEWQAHADTLGAARERVESPEHINDGQHTHPSALLDVLRPRYLKTLDGPAVARSVTLERIRAECAHFARWLTRIEALPPL